MNFDFNLYNQGKFQGPYTHMIFTRQVLESLALYDCHVYLPHMIAVLRVSLQMIYAQFHCLYLKIAMKPSK